jgi:hypothetical protein
VTQAGTPTPPPSGTLLFQEAFDDANVAARGWYDNTAILLSTIEHIPGSVSSLQYTFNQGATAPTTGSALRHKFTPSDSVYLGYWVKYSTNWVGCKTLSSTRVPLLTTLEDDYRAGLVRPSHGLSNRTRHAASPFRMGPTSTRPDRRRFDERPKTVVSRAATDRATYPDNCYSNGTRW